MRTRTRNHLFDSNQWKIERVLKVSEETKQATSELESSQNDNNNHRSTSASLNLGSNLPSNPSFRIERQKVQSSAGFSINQEALEGKSSDSDSETDWRSIYFSLSLSLSLSVFLFQSHFDTQTKFKIFLQTFNRCALRIEKVMQKKATNKWFARREWFSDKRL